MSKKKIDWQPVYGDAVSTDEEWDGDGEIIGTYIARKDNLGEFNSSLYVLQVGDQKIGVWGSTVLNSLMEHVEIGSEVKIIALGLTQNATTGRSYKNFDVYMAPGEVEPKISKPSVTLDTTANSDVKYPF